MQKKGGNMRLGRLLYVGILIVFLLLGFYIRGKEKTGNFESKIKHAIKDEYLKDLEQYASSWEKKEMPKLLLADLNDETVSLSFKSNIPTVYVVWASWCSDCRKELPILDKLYKKYENKLRFISISLVGHNDETIIKASSYYRDNKFSIPLYFDHESNVYNLLKVKAVPTLFLVNKSGIIEKVFIESIAEKELEAALNKLIN